MLPVAGASPLTRVAWENCRKIWEQRSIKKMKDWLEYHNDLDVVAGLQALTKMKVFYSERGVR